MCLDVNLPGGNGLSLCEMLCTDDRMADIPKIILTGRSDPDTIRRCHSMCAYYVEKSSDVWERMGPLLIEVLGPTGGPSAAAGSLRFVVQRVIV